MAEGLKGATLRTFSFYKGDATDENAFSQALLYCGSLYRDIADEAAWVRNTMKNYGNAAATEPVDDETLAEMPLPELELETALAAGSRAP